MKHRKYITIVLSVAIVLHSCQMVWADLTNGGFETDEPTFIWGSPGVPTTFGDWGGDKSEIVTTENGITPLEGIRMLHFVASGNFADPSLTGSEVHQLVDMSAFSAFIDAGLVTASASAWFNRVNFDSETDTLFAVAINAYSGDATQFQTLINSPGPIDRLYGRVWTDSDLDTWEQATVDLLLPTGTDFLDILLVSSENIKNDSFDPEFDGHYADDVSLVIKVVPAPGAALLSGIGISFVGFLLRRKAL